MYDIVIIGGGPGGLSAGLYAGRARLNTLIIEKGSIGGQIGVTDSIENYPGSLVGEHESGKTLTERMRQQAEHFGCEFVFDDVVEVNLKSQPKKITLQSGDVVEAKAVIIATGASPRKLNVPGEKEFAGKGVSYCATCDANFFEDFEVFVVGGGNSAVEEAMYLKKFARKVTIVVRRDVLRCDAIVKEQAEDLKDLNFMYNTSIKEIHGDPLVNKLILVDNKTGEETEYLADEDDGLMGVFVFVGTDPQSEIFKGQVDMTDNGYIITDELMRTNLPLVYAIGDVRNTPLRQVVTAASDGSIAAVSIEKELQTLK
ncbi:MAG: thioredoxin-disulfide reductase [Bacillota bacterium]|nr:thioredoxin-disulfide reductase [Bacillota bacterium]